MTKSIEDFSDMVKNYDPSKNVTRRVLSRYELAKIVGMRMEQLARGAPSYVDTDKHEITNIRDIVLMELKTKKLPFIISRSLPNGTKEYWRIDDLEVPINI
jgi:DNA-directed RNA polymerase subunit K/omega